jgi:NADH dehydrogenase FAD-containing subunit
MLSSLSPWHDVFEVMGGGPSGMEMAANIPNEQSRGLTRHGFSTRELGGVTVLCKKPALYETLHRALVMD